MWRESTLSRLHSFAVTSITGERDISLNWPAESPSSLVLAYSVASDRGLSTPCRISSFSALPKQVVAAGQAVEGHIDKGGQKTKKAPGTAAPAA